jgi:hypothetical protein
MSHAAALIAAHFSADPRQRAVGVRIIIREVRP